MNLNDFTFGVEIECISPLLRADYPREGYYSPAARRVATTEFIARTGLPCVAPAGLDKDNVSSWKCVHDGSVSGQGNTAGRLGMEFVSPVLRGEAGLLEITRVCDALTASGYAINKSCGLHVHVGLYGSRIPFSAVLNAFQLYGSYESVIDSVMPEGRRGRANRFCNTVAHVPHAEVKAAADSVGLMALLNRVYRHDSLSEVKYHKLNPVGHHARGTIEFRQHSGTIEARKMVNWVKFCAHFVATCMRAEPVVSAAAPANLGRPGSDTHRIGELLLRANGATGPEICAIMGWQKVSINNYARACGLLPLLYSTREGRIIRYRVRHEAAALDITLEGMCTLLGLDEEARSYFLRRRAHFVERDARTTRQAA